MHHVHAVIDALQAEPHRGLVVSFLYEGPRPEGDSSVLVQFSALVPVLEALGMYLKAKRDQAFAENGSISDPNAVLDMHGAFMFLDDLMRGARQPTRADSEDLVLWVRPPSSSRSPTRRAVLGNNTP